MRRSQPRLVALNPAVVSTLLLLALVAVGGARADSHRTRDELRHGAEAARGKAAEARAQEQALAGDVAAQSERIDRVESAIGELGSELARLQAELDRSRSLLRRLEVELAEKTRAVRRARVQMAVAQSRLSRRLVALYTSDEPDAVAVALGVTSLDELIDVVDAQSRVAELDAELVRETKALRARVTRERATARRLTEQRAAETARVEARTDARRDAVASLISRRDSLAALRDARQRSLQSVEVQRREWEAQADALEAASARLASVIAEAPPPSGGAETAPAAAASGGFIWPVRGTLVSPYGQRWGRLHAGLDIAAPAGTPVAASASGRVIYAGSMSGYGLIVIVQHSGGIATAYAHNSSISVSVGQAVSQGQAIAAVGCTGRCFGDHVHFEVRAGGNPVDPMGYL